MCREFFIKLTIYKHVIFIMKQLKKLSVKTDMTQPTCCVFSLTKLGENTQHHILALYCSALLPKSFAKLIRSH